MKTEISLYRGDGDPDNKRKIHCLYDPNKNGGFSSSNVLMTNLNNSGNGKEIFKQPFHNLIENHVGCDWGKTHFLSFSEDIERAYYYGSKGNTYIDWTGENKWDFFVLTFSLNQLLNRKIVEIVSGIYKIDYQTFLKEFDNKASILLINVTEYFTYLLNSNIQISSEKIFNAKRDKEWLVLPINGFYNSEYSCYIATEIISRIEYFVMI